MSIINYTSNERDLLARLMRAEALGEGNLGMLMVGNVGVNRVLANCLTFSNIVTLNDMIYQNPGGFSGIDSPLFFSNPTTQERNLANRVLKGEYYYPQLMHYGFMRQAKEILVDLLGMNKEILVSIRIIAFMNQSASMYENSLNKIKKKKSIDMNKI